MDQRNEDTGKVVLVKMGEFEVIRQFIVRFHLKAVKVGLPMCIMRNSNNLLIIMP